MNLGTPRGQQECNNAKLHVHKAEIALCILVNIINRVWGLKMVRILETTAPLIP
jgi:hypothetical protein